MIAHAVTTGSAAFVVALLVTVYFGPFTYALVVILRDHSKRH